MKVTEYQEGMVITEGYYANMPNELYHAHRSISKSGLDLIDRDPFHYFNQKPSEQTRPMQVGSAIHAAILEPSVFVEKYMMLPTLKDRKQPEYKAACKQLSEEHVFVGTECENIENMQRAVWMNEGAAALLSGDGYNELSGFVRDPVTGVMCRHRFDRITADGWAVDIKKTQDVRSEEFAKSIYNYRYHVQDAFYLSQHEWLTGQKLKGMKFICVEEKWPHKVAVYQLCDITKQIGSELMRYNLDVYADWLNREDKPTNNEGCQIISLPEWVMRRFDDEIV